MGMTVYLLYDTNYAEASRLAKLCCPRLGFPSELHHSLKRRRRSQLPSASGSNRIMN
ncbi:hypothetical protein B0T12DRAFT_402197 [Alternaria alternata]|nr:hypothetical protein B0T12DRAFT_402197 [Alternaria alternata]